MSVTWDKTKRRFRFEFKRTVAGRRVRSTRLLPAGWSQAQADAFDRAECARLYLVHSGVQRDRAPIETAVGLYVTRRLPALKHGRNVERELARIYWAYRGRFVDELASVCQEYRDHPEAAGLAPATVRNRLRYLIAACRYAWREHNLGDPDVKPGERTVMPAVRNDRHVYATRAQMLAICRQCPRHDVRGYIRIAFYSGMRLGEILRAIVGHEAFVLTDTKNSDPRSVPIHPRVRCCLRYLPPAIAKITVQLNWRRAADAAGFGHLHFHDLRHSAASAMVQAGTDLFVVGKVLGHRDRRSTERYSHLAPTQLAEAINRIGRQNRPHQPAKKRARKRAKAAA